VIAASPAHAQQPLPARTLGAALLCLTVVAVSFAAVRIPFVISGAVLGLAVLVVALFAPLAMIAVMLVTGPLDLSFLTGGFKSLLPQMGGLDMNGIRLVAATAGFLAYILFQPRSRQALLGPLGRIWIVFLIFATGTLVPSLDRIEGMRLLLKLSYPLLTFLIVVGAADTRERAFMLMRWTLIAAAIVVAVVSPLLAMGGHFHAEDGTARFSGIKGDNAFAFYCSAMLMIVFTRFVLRMQWRYLLFSVLLVLWLLLTGTRIAALASVVGIATIGLLSALLSGNRKILVASAVVACAAGAVLMPTVLVRTFGRVPTPAELFQLARNPLLLYETINWNGRELLWAILWAAFMASPLVGLGLGSSSAVIRTTFPNQNVRVAHNEYMRLATDTGLFGVMLFAASVVAWLVAAIRLSGRGDRNVREFAFPAAAAIVAWALIAITDNAFDYYTDFTQYIGFLVAGAVVMHRLQESPSEADVGDR